MGPGVDVTFIQLTERQVNADEGLYAAFISATKYNWLKFMNLDRLLTGGKNTNISYSSVIYLALYLIFSVSIVYFIPITKYGNRPIFNSFTWSVLYFNAY